jgi:nicotinate dehydrogenase subunit B
MKRAKINEKIKSGKGSSTGIQRRSFIKLLGGGIFVFFQPWDRNSINDMTLLQSGSPANDYNTFLQISEDGTVKCFTGKIEMGQGVITSLSQMMAEELNVPFEKIQIIMGDTDLCPYDEGTWGSMTTPYFGPEWRAAAAEAKGVLLDLASKQLGVPVTQLEAKEGKISDLRNPKKMLTYAQLTKGKKLEKYLDVKPSPEDFAKFTIIGKSYKRIDSKLKVTGQAKFTGDYKLPGMVYARILRPPSHGAKLISVDISGAEQIKGTQVVRDGDFIAVLNENHDRADEAIVKIKAEYSFNELKVNDKTVFDRMVGADSAIEVVENNGDLEAGLKLCDKIFESEFHDPYVAHATIETHCALANLEGDKMTVHASAQSPFGLRDDIVKELGYPKEKVRVITPFVGGGFGGKIAHQQGVEAARLAKLSGKPIMLVWTRDEEFFYDTYHPAGVIRIRSGIDKSGKIQVWDYNVYYSGTRGADTTYNVQNSKITSYDQNENTVKIHPFNTGAWRAPNANTNTFARESQIEKMASAAGIDPLEFRLKNLKDEKMIAVWKAVADKFGYVAGKIPGGRGIGMACGKDAGTWVAMIAEVKVDRNTGHVKVARVACAQDMGMCVNPQGALLQMEGCISMGLGYTLSEEIQFEGGNIKNRGFDNYEIPRFSWIPKMDCIILDRMNMPPKGGGEPAIITIGAAVANAIFDATGARLYRMPFTPARVLEALKKV